MFKTGKRLLAFLLSLAIILPLIPSATVSAAVTAPDGMIAAEAENRFVAYWNSFSNVEGGGTRSDCSGGSMVGSGSHSKNIAYGGLKKDADLSQTSYIRWKVEAPADGNYNISLRYLMYTSATANNQDFTSTPYAAFLVNGETAYQANFQGKNKWVSNTDAVSVALKQGVNEIIAVPLVSDVITALGGNCYANVDCLYVENTLKVVTNLAEAENTELAVWNGYNKTESNTNASGGVQVGGSDAKNNVHFADLNTGVDLSSTAYIQWTVDAPNAGNYDIAMRAHIQIGGSPSGYLSDKVYVTFFVNGKTAYKAPFNGKNGWVYDTDAVSVALEKGTNEIVAIPLVKDIIEANSWGWANADCLYLDSRLTPKAPEPPAVLVKAEAEDTLYAQWNNYSALENRSDASGGVIVGGGKTDGNVLYGDLREGVDLSGTAYVKWIVDAPKEGDYAFGLRYLMKAGPLGNGDVLDSGAYAAFFVNGKSAYKAKFLGKNNWVYDTENVDITLNKGENEIVVIPFVKDLIDSYGHGWANVDCLYLEDTLALCKGARVEAEDTVHSGWNNYNTTEENTNASAGILVGGGDASKNVYFADLVAGADLTDSSWVKWTLTAPADGEYDVALRYSVKIGKLENNTSLDAYAAFFVNGEKAYQAKFLGKNGWVYDTETVRLTLKKGINEIIAIPLIKDLVDTLGGGWANVDCLYIDSRLIPAMNRVEAENTQLTAWNIYSSPEANGNASGGILVGGADASKNVSFHQLTSGVKLNNTAYMKWQVNAPADGEYSLGLRYAMKAGNQENNVELIPEGYAAFLINAETAYKAAFLGKNSWVYDTEQCKVTLKAGVNEIIVIPLVQDLVKAYSWAWANVDCLYLDGQLTVMAAPEIVERPTVMVKAEAEDQEYTFWNSYHTVQGHESASGGKQAGGSAANRNVYFDELKEGVDLSDTAYVQWIFDVPAAGNYTFKLRYNPKADGIKNAEALTPKGYATFFVNGNTTYKAMFEGKNNWVYDTQEISVYLNKGINQVVVIPMVKDLYDAWGGGWANVDCLYYDSLLTLQKAPENTNRPTQLIKLEAEDQSYTQWNSYNTVQDHDSASNGKMAAGSAANRNVYYKDLKKGVDLSDTAYVKWVFDAPAAGQYIFKLRYHPRAESVKPGEALTPAAYAAFFVNGQDVYQASFSGKNDWVYDTQEIRISLNEGLNEIIAIPMVKDLYDAWGGGWANVDCLYYNSVLTPQKAPVKLKVEAEDRSLTYWNGYNTSEPHNSASGGYQAAGSSSQNNVYYKQLKKGVDLTYTAYVKWIITAPEEGDYTFSLRYAPNADNVKSGKALTPEGYAAFFVNGQTAYKAKFLGYDNWVYNTKEIAIHLKKGDNEIIAIPMVKDLYDAWDGGWANVDCLYMQDGLTVKPTGYVEEKLNIAEAEDLSYVQWNLFNTTENNGSATNKLVAAGSNSAANIYAKDLVSGADLSGTAYLKWTVIAPADGVYTFKLRYTAKEDGVKTGDAYKKGNAYATFFVNDSDVYTAPLSGFGARCNWLWDTDSVRIKLNKGENELYVIPLIKDQYDAWGGGWANVDCLKLDTRLSLKKAPVYTRFEAENSEFNLYEGFSTRVGTEDWGSAWENDVTFANLNEETMLAVAHVKYYVYAEKAGTYRLGFGFRQGHNLKEYKDAFFGLSVNLKKNYKVPFTATNAGNDRLVYMDVELEAGDNYLYCTACLKDLMDYPKYPSQKNGYVLWIDHDYILLAEGLTSTVASSKPNWTGDDEADYAQTLLSVWGDLSGEPGQSADDKPENPEAPAKGYMGLTIGLSMGALLITLLIILLLVKRKKKEK